MKVRLNLVLQLVLVCMIICPEKLNFFNNFNGNDLGFRYSKVF